MSSKDPLISYQPRTINSFTTKSESATFEELIDIRGSEDIKKKQKNIWLLIGIVIGCLVVALIIIIIIVIKRKRKNDNEQSTQEMSSDATIGTAIDVQFDNSINNNDNTFDNPLHDTIDVSDPFLHEIDEDI